MKLKVYVVCYLNDDLKWEMSPIYPSKEQAKADPNFKRKGATILSWATQEELTQEQAEAGWE